MAHALGLFQPPGFDCLKLTTSRGQINYYEANPSNPKVMVFLHGFGGGSSSYEWSKVYPAFAADYRVLAPDLPGWGFSEHREQEYLSPDYRAAIAEFLKALCPQPVTVIASSVVAALVVQEANAQPGLFARLILMNAVGLQDFGMTYDGSFFAFVNQLPGINELLYSQLITNRFSIRQFLADRLFAQPNRISEEIVEAYYVSAHQEHGKTAAYSFLKGNFNVDLSDYLPQLQVPTALLWGAENGYGKPELGRRMSQLSPQIRHFAVLADVGQVPQLELPAVTIAAILRALHALE